VPNVADRPLSALPSPAARAIAFAAICLCGLAGGLIGHGFVGLQCAESCATPKAVGLLVGAVAAALGASVVAVLALRAMGEWSAGRSRSRR
jgi:hypothetical protein